VQSTKPATKINREELAKDVETDFDRWWVKSATRCKSSCIATLLIQIFFQDDVQLKIQVSPTTLATIP